MWVKSDEMVVKEKRRDSRGGFEVIWRRDWVKHPEISVIMSVYNAEETVKYAIESIIGQTLKNFEFIIINDGSTDGTFDVLMEYFQKDNRIIIINQENIGLTKSLNRSVEIARGRYIARQDADDVSLNKRLEIEKNFLEERGLDFVGSNVIYINKKREELFTSSLPLEYEDIFSKITKFNPFIHSTILIKSSLLKKYKYDERFEMAQDYDLWLRILEDGYRAMNIKKPLLKFMFSTGDDIKSLKKRNKSTYYSLVALKLANERGKWKIPKFQIIKRKVLLHIPVYIKRIYHLFISYEKQNLMKAKVK